MRLGANLPGRQAGGTTFCHSQGVLHVQCEVYNRVTGLGATGTYVRCSRHILLLLLAVCNCVVADSTRRKNDWADVVQRAKDRSGQNNLRAERAIEN